MGTCASQTEERRLFVTVRFANRKDLCVVGMLSTISGNARIVLHGLQFPIVPAPRFTIVIDIATRGKAADPVEGVGLRSTAQGTEGVNPTEPARWRRLAGPGRCGTGKAGGMGGAGAGISLIRGTSWRGSHAGPPELERAGRPDAPQGALHAEQAMGVIHPSRSRGLRSAYGNAANRTELSRRALNQAFSHPAPGTALRSCGFRWRPPGCPIHRAIESARSARR